MANSLDVLVRKFTDDLRALMREELSAEVTAAVQAALGGRKPVRNGKVAGRAKGGKRTAEEIAKQAEKVYGFVKDNDGVRSEQIANSLGVTTGELVLPLKKLLADKRIKATGKARGTTYTAKG